MSRLIVKNIPTNFEEAQVQEYFKKVGIVTDCKVARTPNGKSRRFCFIGYKNVEDAEKARKYFNNTYVGASKVVVDFAKTKDQVAKTPDNRQGTNPKNEKSLSKNKNRSQNDQVDNNPSVEKAKQKFQQYKEILVKGSKQSWNDLLVPEDVVRPVQTTMKKKKKQLKEQKIRQKALQQATQQPQQEEKPQKQSKNGSAKGRVLKQYIPPAVKPLRLSERNQQFIEKPLQIDETRLYVTNIPYDCSIEEILKVFSRYGNVLRSKIPVSDTQTGRLKGFGFITYEKPEEALRAFSELDNKIVFGKILHVKPALEDVGKIIKDKKEQAYQQRVKEKFGEVEEDKTAYKKKKKMELRKKLDDTTSWNTLFLNPNTILEHIAKKNNMTKSEILESDNLAVKVALAETEVIAETKEWMISEGLSLDFMETDRALCERSKDTILVKNLHHNTQPNDLKEMFNYYGLVDKLLLCPNRSLAIVKFRSKDFAQNVMEKLAYYSYKSNPLYLQFAPVGLMDSQKVKSTQKELQQQELEAEELSKILYVKNLNFETKEETLRKLVEKLGNIKSVKIIRDKEGNSLGYGFIEFDQKEAVLKAIKQYQNHILEGHALQLSVSKKKVATTVDNRKKTQTGFEPTIPKLVIRNIAFQATKQEVRDLFKEFGAVKSVRLPKKMDGQHRGFAFVEFETMEEARQAFTALGSSHLYGRKLVVEWEESSAK